MCSAVETALRENAGPHGVNMVRRGTGSLVWSFHRKMTTRVLGFSVQDICAN